MIPFDISAVLLGLAIGTVIGGLFFAGLALGMRYALRAPNPLPLLVLSTAVRVIVLLGVGWVVASQGGAWALGGYGMAFVIARFIATTVARVGAAT